MADDRAGRGPPVPPRLRSLSTRFIGALLLALALAGLLITVHGYLQFRQFKADPQRLQVAAQAVLASLDGVEDDGEAARLLAGLRRASAVLAEADGGAEPWSGPPLIELRNAAGRVVYRWGESAAMALRGAAPGATAFEYAGRRYQSVRAADARWTVVLAEPGVDDRPVLVALLRELLPDLMLGFVAMLLPIGAVVHYGLQPLRRLADHLRERRSDDLAAIDIDPRYAELATVAASFNQLLARLGARLQRERAFVQDAAHELRTPMAVIAAQAHLLMRAADEGQRRQAADDLQLAIERASHLSRQLLELAALDEGQREPARRFDVAEWLRHELAASAGAAAARGIDLALDAPDRLPWALDAVAFQSIVSNLLGNALRYVNPGGRVQVTLEQGAGRGVPASCLRLTVADDGPGIAPQDRARIFDRFVRGTGQPAGGTGLGLAIVQAAVAALGGRVWLADGLDRQGVAFVVQLPG